MLLHVAASESTALLSMMAMVAVSFVCHTFGMWSTTFDLVLGVSMMVISLRQVAKGKPCPWPSVDYSGRVALVTGASRGIGFYVALELAAHGWTVVITGRDKKRLSRAADMIERQVKGAVVVAIPLDLSDFVAVRKFAGDIATRKLAVGLLVNNAGELQKECQRVSSGHERMMASNALGPMLLTQLLLPILEKTASTSNVTSRIVNVASSAHTFVGLSFASPLEAATGIKDRPLRFSWWNFVEYYGLSKLALVWYTRVLARNVSQYRFTDEQKSQKIMAVCCHPGIICSSLYRCLLPEWLLRVVYLPSLLIGKTMDEGAQAVLRCCVAQEGMTNGSYYMCGGDYGPNSGVNCLSKHALNLECAFKFCQWAGKELDLSK